MNRRTVLFGAVLVIGIVALWWVFLYSPKAKDLSDAHDQRDEAERQTQTLNAELAQLRDLHRRSPETEAQLGKLAAAIPESPNQSDFITGLDAIAEDSGISWQSVTMSEPTIATGGAPPAIATQIKIGGGFFQVTDYLNRLEELDRLVVVDHVTINSEGGGSGSGSSSRSGSGSSEGGVTSGDGELGVTLNARIFSQTTLDGAAPAGGSSPTGAPSGSSGSTGSGGSAGSGGSTNTTETTGVTN